MTTCKLYPFIFRFGVSFNYVIPQKVVSKIPYFLEKKGITSVQLYNTPSRHSSKVRSGEKAPFPESTEPVYSISIAEGEDANGNRVIEAFNARARDYGLLDYSNAVLFIDIEKAPSDKLFASLFSHLARLSRERFKDAGSSIKFFVFVHQIDLKSRISDNLHMLQGEYDLLSHSCIFDSYAQEYRFVNGELTIVKNPDLYDLIKNITTTAVERLDFKLLRKINHFRKVEKDQHLRCLHFFYEGDNCIPDLYQIFKEKIIALDTGNGIPSRRINKIVYSSVRSPWLIKALENVGKAIGSFYSNSVDFVYYGTSDIVTSNEPDPRPMEILFVCDFIDTGATLMSSGFPSLKKLYPNSEFVSMALMITDKAKEDFGIPGEDTLLSVDGNKIEFIKQVHQHSFEFFPGRDVCPFCRFNIVPLVDFEEATSPHLSSFEMWFMSQEAGYEVRRTKKGEDRVLPKFFEIIKRNGSLLAYKFEALLTQRLPTDDRPELIFVYQDETMVFNMETGRYEASLIEETPTGYFVKCMHLHNSNFTYFGVPSAIVKQIEEDKVQLGQLTKTPAYAIFFNQLDGLIRGNKKIIIFDIINYENQTLGALDYILRVKGKPNTPVFSLFDFTSGEQSKGAPGRQSYISLYNFELQ